MHPGEWKQDSANETTINVFECALDGKIEVHLNVHIKIS